MCAPRHRRSVRARSEPEAALLGCIDPYDDTVFNRSQLKVLIPELRALTEGSAAEEAEAVYEILALTAQVERKLTGTSFSTATNDATSRQARRRRTAG